MYPECRRKEWQTKSFGLQSTPRESGPKFAQGLGWRNYISDFSWSSLGVEPAELFEIAVDCELFPLGAAAPASLPKGKADMKMSVSMNM